MIIPAAEFIEAARDQLKEIDAQQLQKQEKELHEAIGAQSQEFTDGFQLGLQTARVLLSGMMSAVENKVSI